MEKAFRIIGFAGPKFSGKDTAAKALFALNKGYSKNLFRQQMMAGPAKRIAVEAFGFDASLLEDPVRKEIPLPTWPFICPRQLVIDVANWYRDKYTGEVWARRWEQEARLMNANWGAHVITDVRFPEEIKMIQRNHGCLVYIQRDIAEVALTAQQAAGDEMAKNVSESHYDYIKAVANVIISNNDGIDTLHQRVRAASQNFFNHWRTWPEVEHLAGAYKIGMV